MTAIPEPWPRPDMGTNAMVNRARAMLAGDPGNPWCAYALAKSLALAGYFAGLGEAQARAVYVQVCGCGYERAIRQGWREFVASDWWARRNEL